MHPDSREIINLTAGTLFTELHNSTNNKAKLAKALLNLAALKHLIEQFHPPEWKFLIKIACHRQSSIDSMHCMNGSGKQ